MYRYLSVSPRGWMLWFLRGNNWQDESVHKFSWKETELSSPKLFGRKDLDHHQLGTVQHERHVKNPWNLSFCMTLSEEYFVSINICSCWKTFQISRHSTDMPIELYELNCIQTSSRKGDISRRKVLDLFNVGGSKCFFEKKFSSSWAIVELLLRFRRGRVKLLDVRR